MTSIVSPIEGQFLGRLGPRFGEVPVSWRLLCICFFAHQPQPKAHMDERRTLRILGWSLSGVVLLLFALAALSLPH